MPNLINFFSTHCFSEQHRAEPPVETVRRHLLSQFSSDEEDEGAGPTGLQSEEEVPVVKKQKKKAKKRCLHSQSDA